MFTKWLDIQPIYKNKSYICTGESKMKTHTYIYIKFQQNIRYLGISQTKILHLFGKNLKH